MNMHEDHKYMFDTVDAEPLKFVHPNTRICIPVATHGHLASKQKNKN